MIIVLRLYICLGLFLGVPPIHAAQAQVEPTPTDRAAVHRAMVNLTLNATSGATLPLVFTPNVFDHLWQAWDHRKIADLRIASLSQREKRKLVFDHYGLLENPNNPLLPLGFVTRNGFLSMNCLACHSGSILGQNIIGLPNRNIDLNALFNDLAKLHPIPGLFLTQLAFNFGPERGLVVSPGIESTALNLRDLNMNLKVLPNNLGRFQNSVVNAPAWWNIEFKTHIFADAVLPITPRVFVPNMTTILDSGPAFKSAESSVSDAFVLAKSTKPPKFPGKIDSVKAQNGKAVFETNCAKCHGQYEIDGKILDYPNKIVRINIVETDPERAFPSDSLASYAGLLNFLKLSWIGEDFKSKIPKLSGYIAPPLLGIWATAPYLHNGSVPTLWELLNSAKRPKIWRASESSSDYDLEKVGIKYQELKINSEPTNSHVYDTSKKGRGSYGHRFPDKLTQSEKIEVLEFLKCL